MGGRNVTLQSFPSDDQTGINTDGQLRKAAVSNGPEYYNPNPWVRILGRANETEIEIDGKNKQSFNRQWCHYFNDE